MRGRGRRGQGEGRDCASPHWLLMMLTLANNGLVCKTTRENQEADKTMLHQQGKSISMGPAKTPDLSLARARQRNCHAHSKRETLPVFTLAGAVV